MIAPNLNSLCKQARLYYYDFLFNKCHGVIPEPVIDHIDQCQRCQERIDQLKAALLPVGSMELEQSEAASAITGMLQLHFAYIGKRVTCETVKPFLPALLDPALQIRIPTPITGHVDNCKRCSQDLQTMQSLNLNPGQLRRLSQLFADKPHEGNVSCSQAKAGILALVYMVIRKTNEGVLNHLCTCPNCRKLLYQYRKTVCKELLDGREEREELICKEVSVADIFDYVVPYGLGPADDQYGRLRESLTSHISTCPVCLAKMQELHNTVYGIAERAESGIVTIYSMDESAAVQGAEESNDPYSGFPVKVEVINREDEVKAEQPALSRSFAAAWKPRISAKKLAPWAKAAAIAAAVLIAVALLLNTSTAKALTIDQIYTALEKARNVYISKSVPSRAGPIEEKWVSRPLNIYVSKTGKELVLWDLANKVRKTRQLGTDLVETTPLSNDLIAQMRTTITGSLGLMPFNDISKIPPDAEWRSVTNSDLKATAKDANVYDLTWVERRYGGSAMLNMCRVFADPKKNLPQRVEGYQRLDSESEYTLRLVMVVKYLSDSEIEAVIKDGSF